MPSKPGISQELAGIIILLSFRFCWRTERTESWFAVFAMLWLAGYAYSAFEFMWIAGGTLKARWNEQRMRMMKAASPYLVALIQVICKLLGIAEVGFQVTSKVFVVDAQAIRRYEAEVLEFGEVSWVFIPPPTMLLIDIISVSGGIGRLLLQPQYFGCMFAQLFWSSFIVIKKRLSLARGYVPKK